MIQSMLPVKIRLRRQSGAVLVWVTVSITALMGMGAVAIDLSMWYSRKADLQKTADMAAEAGAASLRDTKTLPEAKAISAQIAQANGYPISNIATDISFPYENHDNWYGVKIHFTEPLYFAGVLGLHPQYLEATGTAFYTTYVDAPIPKSDYGFSGLATNWSMFGLYAHRQFGDRYSPLYLDDGSSAPPHPNPECKKDGYDFTIAVPPDYKSKNSTGMLQVELFDPDTNNSLTPGVNASAVIKNTNGDVIAGAVDEIRAGWSAPQNAGWAGESHDYTNTQFDLVYTKNGVDTTIASASYGNDVATDMKWVTPPNFTIDTSSLDFSLDASGNSKGRLHLQVKTTDGGSENGFAVRAGPPHATNTLDSSGNPTTSSGAGTYQVSAINEAVWHDKYSGAPGTTGANLNGTGVAAHGNIPLNFNTNGTAEIILGSVGASTSGGKFWVQRFDTDIPASGNNVGVEYYHDYKGDGNFVLYTDVSFGSTDKSVCNNTTVEDTINLPANYPGGVWKVRYTAGGQDSSVWTLRASTGKGGDVGLTGLSGQLH